MQRLGKVRVRSLFLICLILLLFLSIPYEHIGYAGFIWLLFLIKDLYLIGIRLGEIKEQTPQRHVFKIDCTTSSTSYE